MRRKCARRRASRGAKRRSKITEVRTDGYRKKTMIPGRRNESQMGQEKDKKRSRENKPKNGPRNRPEMSEKRQKKILKEEV